MIGQTITPTYQGFIEFVNSQPPEKKINHGASWDECAIGEYLTSIGYDLSRSYPFAGNVAAGILPVDLYRTIGNQRLAKIAFPTYGNLANYLSNNV